MTTDAAKTTMPENAVPRADSRGKGRPRATRKAQLIVMLNRKGGADVAAISRKFGWQPHTTRAALTGLRKAGYEIVAEKSRDGQPARYRIATEPASVAG